LNVALGVDKRASGHVVLGEFDSACRDLGQGELFECGSKLLDVENGSFVDCVHADELVVNQTSGAGKAG